MECWLPPFVADVRSGQGQPSVQLRQVHAVDIHRRSATVWDDADASHARRPPGGAVRPGDTGHPQDTADAAALDEVQEGGSAAGGGRSWQGGAWHRFEVFVHTGENMKLS